MVYHTCESAIIQYIDYILILLNKCCEGRKVVLLLQYRENILIGTDAQCRQAEHSHEVLECLHLVLSSSVKKSSSIATSEGQYRSGLESLLIF